MASDFTVLSASRDIVLRRVSPTTFRGKVEAGETFTGGEPLTLNASGRFVRATSNSVDIAAISGQGVTGLAGGSGIIAYQLGDGSLWSWVGTRFARDGIGTLVAVADSDIGDLAGLVFTGGNWVVDTGASNKTVKVTGISGSSGVVVVFLRASVSQVVASGSIVFSSGLVTFTEITPGDIITTGAFGGLRERLHQVGVITGNFTPDNSLFNNFRFEPNVASLELSNPSTNPANDESQTLTFLIVSSATVRTVTLGLLYKLAGGGASFTTSGVDNEEQVLSCKWNGTNWRCVLSAATAA